METVLTGDVVERHNTEETVKIKARLKRPSWLKENIWTVFGFYWIPGKKTWIWASPCSRFTRLRTPGAPWIKSLSSYLHCLSSSVFLFYGVCCVVVYPLGFCLCPKMLHHFVQQYVSDVDIFPLCESKSWDLPSLCCWWTWNSLREKNPFSSSHLKLFCCDVIL